MKFVAPLLLLPCFYSEALVKEKSWRFFATRSLGFNSMREEHSDLLFWNNALGMYLRDARMRAGLSLRELEKRSGVSDSEIHKIETGSQECRLSSFIKVCAAIGIPGGLVLDQVVSSSMAYFHPIVEKDSTLESFINAHWKVNSFGKRALTGQIACLCSVAAHLLRCADATRKAASFQYPDPHTERVFVDFGRTVDETSEGLERLSILAALEQSPLAELERHKILCLHLLNFVARRSSKIAPRGKTVEEIAIRGEGVPMWWPLPAPETPFTKRRGFRKKGA